MNDQSHKWIGKRTIRPDGADKVTGRAKYTADLRLPGMLHGKILRSPHPHARIRSIDTAAAQAMFNDADLNGGGFLVHHHVVVAHDVRQPRLAFVAQQFGKRLKIDNRRKVLHPQDIVGQADLQKSVGRPDGSTDTVLLEFLTQQKWAAAYEKNQSGQNTVIIQGTTGTPSLTLPAPAVKQADAGGD